MIRPLIATLVLIGLVWSHVGTLTAQPSAASQQQQAYEIKRDLIYACWGKRQMHLDLYLPKKPKAARLPVVVWIHGGGWRAGNKSSGRLILPHFVRTWRYCGVAVEYRLTGEAPWPAQIHDCKAALRWIRAHAHRFGMNPDKIGVVGGSAGGHLAALLGTSGGVEALEGPGPWTQWSSQVQAVVEFCGPTDLVAVAQEELLPEVRKMLEAFLGPGGKKAAREASPTTYISPDDPPVLIVHGTEDRIVPFSQALIFHQALRQAQVECYLYRIQGAGHAIGGPHLFDEALRFFDHHLWAKTTQFQDRTIPKDQQ